MVNAFLFSFGTSHGYIVISADVPTGHIASLIKLAIVLSGINFLNCFLGFLGSLHIGLADRELKLLLHGLTTVRGEEASVAPVMVVHATEVSREPTEREECGRMMYAI